MALSPSPVKAPPRPARFAHVVLRSFDMQRLKQWYCDVFGLEIVVESDRAAFATFDDEHHRFAFVQLPGTPDDGYRRPSTFAHGAYALASLDELLAQYRHMEALGIPLAKCANHGPTFSLYYDDPDGNGIEFFVDRFATMAESKAFMQSDTFRKNLVGYELDAADFFALVEAGGDPDELMAYDQDAADAAAAQRARAFASRPTS